MTCGGVWCPRQISIPKPGEEGAVTGRNDTLSYIQEHAMPLSSCFDIHMYVCGCDKLDCRVS